MQFIKSKQPYLYLLIPFLLLIPMIAMQFTSAVDWSLGDFLIMGTLLFTTITIGLGIYNKVEAGRYRWLLITIVVLLFLLVWAELAVGIFSQPT